jgi:hypothetical protein
LIKANYLEDGLQVIDLEIKSKYSKDYFQNEEHLNIRGARKFTSKIKEILSNS